MTSASQGANKMQGLTTHGRGFNRSLLAMIRLTFGSVTIEVDLIKTVYAVAIFEKLFS